MRLAVDGRELFFPYGMGRLLLATIKELLALYPGLEISVFLNRKREKLLKLFGEFPAQERRLHFYESSLSLSSLIWENHFLRPNLTDENFDLFYLPHNHTGLLSIEIPMVALICDVIPLVLPHFYHFVEETRLRTVNAARLSSRIVTISECSKRDCERYLGVPAAKISVNYPGLEGRFTTVKDQAKNKQALASLGISPQYFLNVGGFDPRKNIGVLLRGFASYLEQSDDQINLVIVGPLKALRVHHQPVDLFQMLKELGLEERVIFTDVVSDELLVCLYQEAEAMIYPSLYEGFGLPPAESLACGTPVIVSNASSLPEVVGESGFYFAPDDYRELANQMALLRTEKTSTQQRVATGAGYISRFTSRNWADRLYRMFEETVR